MLNQYMRERNNSFVKLAKVKIHTRELLHKGVEREGVEKKPMDHVLYADSHLGPGERLIMQV